LDRVRRVVRLTGFVVSGPDFTDLLGVLNGASDMMARAFADAGRHARVAVGAPVLPGGATVQVEAIFELA